MMGLILLMYLGNRVLRLIGETLLIFLDEYKRSMVGSDGGVISIPICRVYGEGG